MESPHETKLRQALKRAQVNGMTLDDVDRIIAEEFKEAVVDAADLGDPVAPTVDASAVKERVGTFGTGGVDKGSADGSF